MAETQGDTTHQVATGITGLDDITRGGLPTGRVTLVSGGAGSGKTILALQCLVHGATSEPEEPAIFVAFEESARRIVANAATFGWDLPELQRRKLFFLDAQPHPNLMHSGQFDLDGMLAGLDARIQDMGAQRIVFDAIDVVLSLLPDAVAIRQQVYALHDWLQERELTAIITRKSGSHGESLHHLDFLQFMVDCVINLDHRLVDGISHRSLQVVKFRGSGFEENAAPLVIGGNGMQVARSRGVSGDVPEASEQRLSTGVERLDSMLDGGYFRGAGILLTGGPGTAKTSLCGAFAEAACARGDRVLFVSFDSRADELVRNLKSISIDLAAGRDAGLLNLVAARSIAGSSEIHLMRIQEMAEVHGADCLIIDPLSALAKQGNVAYAHSVVERLVDWAKYADITLLCTSLLGRDANHFEGTPLQISTIADTWIHLTNQERAGERNRGLTVIKSRGTAHSNQVRELRLSDSGISLADVYIAGGEVLMGTLRYEKEHGERLERSLQNAESRRRRLQLEGETAELEARLEAIRRQLEAKRAEHEEVERASRDHEAAQSRADAGVHKRRGVDERGSGQS